MKLILAFLLLIPLLATAARTQYFDAANYNFNSLGNITDAELYRLQGATSNIQGQINGLVSDTAYDATSWNGVTAVAPSKNAVRDQIEAMLLATAGLVSDTAYNAGTWDGITTVSPSKNAVRDQIESILTSISATVSDTAYNQATWDAVTTIAPSKNAVRDEVETLVTSIGTKQGTLTNSAGLAAALSDETGTGFAVFSASPALTGSPTAPTQSAADNSTKIATTAYVDTADALDVHLAGSQTITGDKLFTGQVTATSTTKGNRLCPVMTDAQMSAIAAPANGDCVYNSDFASPYYYSSTDAAWKLSGGGGSGALDTIFQLDADENISGWASGDNATFLGGGTLSGTFVKETASPLKGTNSYKYTQAAGSLNDYIASPVQTVGIRFRGNLNTFTFPFIYDGSPTDIEPVIWDVTNSAYISTSTNLLPSTSTNASIYKVNAYIPLTCTQIRVGFYVKALNSGKILKFDDYVASADSTKYADTGTITDWASYTPTFTGFGTAASVEVKWRRVGGNVEISGKFTAGTTTATEARLSLPNSYTSASTTYIPSLQVAGLALKGTSSSNHGGAILAEPSVAYVTFGNPNTISNTASISVAKANGDAYTTADVISFFASIPIAGLTSSNPQIVTASESFSTDTANLVFAGSATYTPATLPDSPIGTFITFTYAAVGNTATQTTTAPTQTTSDMGVNGILVTGRAYSATSTSTTPCRFDINVGKLFKGDSLQAFASTSKNDPIAFNYRSGNAAITTQSGTDKGYDPDTGIYTINACTDASTLSSTRNVGVRPDTSVAQSAGYFVLNSSKSPALVGVPQVQPRIATLSDVKATSANGGGATSGSWFTRTLNTLVDDTNFIVSLSASEFTLPIGIYYIDAWAQAYSVDNHQIRIATSAGTEVITGRSATSISGAAPTQIDATLHGRLIVTTQTTYKLQHQVTTTKNTNGAGVPGTFAANEIYAMVKITKIK